MLKVEKLRAGYGAINILWDLDFEINEGEIVAFLGSNGAGKTTTVRAVTGLIKPSAGSVNFNGTDLARKNSRTILDAGVVQVPEGRQLFTEMTVLENLEMGAFNKATREAFQKNLKTVYQWFPKLEERAQQAAGTLSGGEQQMVAVAEINTQGGVNMNGHSAESYTVVWIFKTAIEAAGSTDGEAVRDALAALDIQGEFPGGRKIVLPYDRIKFENYELAGAPHFRDNTSASVAIGQVQDGEWKTVWPFDFTDTQILYPAPL
ncbi:MAG: ATP-binding cassette domain-containing protein [Anaerolineaceae bacterium]|nr:ATP-binding cassette domain-containing protein [Anaerolineaceae bacterium]